MTYSAVNTIWLLIGAALVFFMQAGFSMCEAGFTRAKSTGNILLKNLMDFCIGTPVFWLIGFGIMFGSGTALFGAIFPKAFHFGHLQSSRPSSVPPLLQLFPALWQNGRSSALIVFTQRQFR